MDRFGGPETLQCQQDTMDELDLTMRIDMAQVHLKSLQALLDQKDPAPSSSELATVLGSLMDLLERVRSNSQLLMEVLSRTRGAVYAKDRAGRYLIINQEGAEMFGNSVEEVIGQDDTALFENESAQRIMAIDHSVINTGKSQTFEGTFNIRGIPTTLLVTQTAWYERDGLVCGLIGTAQDITQTRRAESWAATERSRLEFRASEIIATERNLRRSLATKLHEGLGQDLALAKLKLAAMRNAPNGNLREALAQIEELIQQADLSLRSVTAQLGPQAAPDFE